jgi:hypothetical protein
VTGVVIGLACRVDQGKANVGLVELERDNGSLLATAFTLRPSAHHDLSQQLLNLAADVETRLKDRRPVAIAVATMENWGGGRRTPHEPSTRLRLRIEGILLATARHFVDSEVPALTGQQMGHECGTDKKSVLAQASDLVGKRDELVDACAAALAALARSER